MAIYSAHPWHPSNLVNYTGVRIAVSLAVLILAMQAKALLDEFVRDSLLLLGRPEWPASALCISLLSALFCRRCAATLELEGQSLRG